MTIKEELKRSIESLAMLQLEKPTTFYKALREIERLESLIQEAPKFFATCDFEGKKLEWLKKANLI